MKTLEQQIAELQSQLRERDADCAAMREALDLVKTFELDQERLDKALSTDAGKSLLDRLQAVERDNGLLKEQIRVADVAYQSLHERHQAVENEHDRLRTHVIEFLNDWKKGDFRLSKLAECDARAMEEALQPAQKDPQ